MTSYSSQLTVFFWFLFLRRLEHATEPFSQELSNLATQEQNWMVRLGNWDDDVMLSSMGRWHHTLVNQQYPLILVLKSRERVWTFLTGTLHLSDTGTKLGWCVWVTGLMTCSRQWTDDIILLPINSVHCSLFLRLKHASEPFSQELSNIDSDKGTKLNGAFG